MNKQFIIQIGARILPTATLSFLASNKEDLSGLGVDFPLDWAMERLCGFPMHTPLYLSFGKSNIPLENIEHSFRQSFSQHHTILLLWQESSMTPSGTKNFLNFLQTRFPDAARKLFLVFAPQESDFERLAALRMLSGNGRHIEDFAKNYISYPGFLEQLIAWNVLFGKEHVHMHLAPDIDTDVGDARIIRELLSLARVCDRAPDGLIWARPGYNLCLPGEFLHFAAAHGACVGDKVAPCSPWSSQACRFMPQAGWEKGHALLTPALRATLRDFYESGNRRLARMLGLDRLFPDSKPQPDREPFTGMTEETAFKVAERLERDFARARMAEFDAAPVQYMTPEQRVCRQALHDTLAPPSAPSLLRSSRQPKVSVLTLTYNHAPYIAECMDSVIAQETHFPIQHIIADDGSDDGTQDIILDYAAKYPHIVPAFQKTRSRGPKNVRALFELARTEYVALCEGDDYFADQSKLQTQADFLDEHRDCALCFHPVRVVYEGNPDKERVYPPVEELPRGIRPHYYASELARVNFIQTNSVMYRWIFKDGLPDWFHAEIMQGDWYWHMLHAEKGKIGFINKVMSVYRRHQNALYYLSEINRQEHRYKLGLRELQAYHIMNEQFAGRYGEHFLRLSDGVIADILYQARKVGDSSIVDSVNDKYPIFANHFMQTLAAMKARNPDQL